MSRNWNQWQNGKGEGKRKGRGNQQDKEKDRPKEKAGTLPGYDAVVPSSSSTSTRDTKLDDQVKLAMREVLQTNHLEVPEVLRDSLEPKMNEEVNLAQKHLNAKRKLIQKLERLQGAKEKKAASWTQFQEKLKEHLLAEKTRFETEQEELETAIKETRNELEKMKATDVEMGQGGKPPSEVEPSNLETEENMDPELLAKVNEEQQRLIADQVEMLRQAQAGQLLLAQQMAEIQEQMKYFMQTQSGPLQATPVRTPRASPAMVFTPEQTVKHPGTKTMDSYGKAANRNSRKEPYSKTEKPEKTEPTEAEGVAEIINLTEMDGTSE